MHGWSKKRFHEFCLFLLSTNVSAEDITKIKAYICEHFHFDPEAKASSEKQRSATKAYREKLKEKGISTYISAGRKQAYYKNKQSEAAT